LASIVVLLAMLSNELRITIKPSKGSAKPDRDHFVNSKKKKLKTTIIRSVVRAP